MAVCNVPRVHTSQRDTDMRSPIASSAILIASLFSSPPTAVAQTFDFPTQIPGPLVRESRELQDRLPDARSGAPDRSVGRTARNYQGSKSAKPVVDATPNLGTKGER